MNFEIEDYEEGFEIAKEIETSKKRTAELEDDCKVMVWEDARAKRFREFASSRNHKLTEQNIEKLRLEFNLQEERNRNPNVVILPTQKLAPYAIWEDANSLCDQLGFATGHDSIETEDVEKSILESIPENTLRAYRGDIRYIGAWLSLMGADFWKPLTEDWIVSFIIDHLEGFKSEKSQEVELRLIEERFKSKAGAHSFETVRRRLAALSNFCKYKKWNNPVRSERVNFILKQLRKKHAEIKQPRAITRNILIHMLEHTSEDAIGIRDRALLSFIFASGGRRRSEVEAACIKDLEDHGDCFLFHMKRSKTNKTGNAESKPIQGMAARYLKDWLSVLNVKEGPLFRPVSKSGEIKQVALKGVFISRIIKKLAEKSGYNPEDFSAHSMRSGFVTQAAREGCSLPEVQALTGHKSTAMVSRYYQNGDVLKSKAGNLF